MTKLDGSRPVEVPLTLEPSSWGAEDPEEQRARTPCVCSLKRFAAQPKLSEREQQVVQMATAGSTNKEIAFDLGLAHSTVRVLLARAARKLGARSRVELVSISSARAACPPVLCMTG